jgi:hypothetical protein
VIDTLVPGLAELWAETEGDHRVSIAVLDGPVDQDHPAFAGARLTWVATLVDPAVASGLATRHGTQVASIVFGSHDSPVQGIASGCRGLVIPIFQDVIGAAPMPSSQIDLARAINQAVQAGADIINISGGEFSPSGAAHPILADAVRNCAEADVLIVAAAGNQGCDCLQIPAALPAVLSVGAMGTDGEPLDFSNWGAVYRSQGVLAPGHNILAAVPGGGVVAVTGTSYATPIITGAVALLMSAHWNRHGTRLSPLEVRDAILRTAIHCGDQSASECPRLLGGRLYLPGASALLLPQPGPSTLDDQPDPAPTPRVDLPLPQSPQEALDEIACDPCVGTAVPAIESQVTIDRSVLCGSGNDCGCGSDQATRRTQQLVYALGRLGFDFGTDARRARLTQAMGLPKTGPSPYPHDPLNLLAYLEQNPWDAASVIWTLTIDATVVYAILPVGPFATFAYQKLRQHLGEQVTGQAVMVCIPGVEAGSARLANGLVVPSIIPEIRGMCSVSMALITDKATSAAPANTLGKAPHPANVDRINNFLDRVYFELRNLGRSPRERALNFAGTRAFPIAKVYEQALAETMELDTIDVERSPDYRPESDCWDVKLTFFFPERQVQTVRKTYRFTIDVSDIVPVTVGPVRSWYVR